MDTRGAQTKREIDCTHIAKIADKPYTERMDKRSFLKRVYELFLLAMLLIAALFAVPFLMPILFTAISACFQNRLSDLRFSAPRRGVVMLQ
ncbi:MAG: hypothetical protein AAGU77_12415 [Bacillota bacterium]